MYKNEAIKKASIYFQIKGKFVLVEVVFVDR